MTVKNSSKRNRSVVRPASPNYALYEQLKRELDAMNLPYPKHERRRRQIERKTGV